MNRAGHLRMESTKIFEICGVIEDVLEDIEIVPWVVLFKLPIEHRTAVAARHYVQKNRDVVGLRAVPSQDQVLKVKLRKKIKLVPQIAARLWMEALCMQARRKLQGFDPFAMLVLSATMLVSAIAMLVSAIAVLGSAIAVLVFAGGVLVFAGGVLVSASGVLVSAICFLRRVVMRFPVGKLKLHAFELRDLLVNAADDDPRKTAPFGWIIGRAEHDDCAEESLIDCHVMMMRVIVKGPHANRLVGHIVGVGPRVIRADRVGTVAVP